jgi:hypothetical protein
MHEDTSRDAADLGEVGIADSAPCLGERAAVLEALRALGDTLDTPLRVGVVGVLRVENVEDGLGGLECALDGEEVVLPGSRLGLLAINLESGCMAGSPRA